ncbi:unnamed protein product [Rhizophagus irregularis]|nr:unnamed protein product [Rhizophagus irregularis]
MRNSVAILALIISFLTFISSEVSASYSSCQKDLKKCKKEKKEDRLVIGPSKDAFKKNLPQDFCAIFKKGGSKEGQLRQANGTQILTGVCSNTPQGEIPKVENMPSTLILYPDNGDKIKKNEPFTIKVKTQKLELGFFSDPAITYNTFPQVLNKHGLNDPSKDGILNVKVDKGLPKKGLYRMCTIISSFSHQSVVLPKAQRGASDDCVRFSVV